MILGGILQSSEQAAHILVFSMDISCVCFILLSSIRASTIRNFFEGFSIGYFTLFSPQFGTHKQLFLGETLIFGRYTYFWEINLFLDYTLIFGQYTFVMIPDGHRTDIYECKYKQVQQQGIGATENNVLKQIANYFVSSASDFGQYLNVIPMINCLKFIWSILCGRTEEAKE